METQTEPNNAAIPTIERVFDENGNTVEEVVPPPPEAVEQPEEPPTAAAAAPAPTPTGPKFRIGDREFATQEEALAYAEDTARSATAQQQIMQTLQQPQPAPTPAVTAPEAVPEEFFQNPSAYLKKFGEQVYQQTMAQVQRMQQTAQQSDAIWREFVDRHPELADFRTDVENFVQGNLPAVQGIISTKGRAAGLDYVATKLKSDWSRKAEMLKPKRDLANTQTPRTPTQRAAAVTAEPAAKKPLSFSEQINNIRRRGRAK